MHKASSFVAHYQSERVWNAQCEKFFSWQWHGQAHHAHMIVVRCNMVVVVVSFFRVLFLFGAAARISVEHWHWFMCTLTRFKWFAPNAMDSSLKLLGAQTIVSFNFNCWRILGARLHTAIPFELFPSIRLFGSFFFPPSVHSVRPLFIRCFIRAKRTKYGEI